MSLLILVSQFALIISNFEFLPNRIPIHTTAGGEVDQWGPKWTLWLMPGINILILGVIFYFHARPEVLNYSTPVTEENKHKLYAGMQKFLMILAVITSIVILLVTLQTINYVNKQESIYTQGIILMITILSLSPLFAIAFVNGMGRERGS